MFLEADDYENPLTLSDKGILGYFDEVHCNEEKQYVVDDYKCKICGKIIPNN